MALLDGFRGLADGYRAGTARRRRWLAGRRVVAGVMGPVLAASSWVVPVAAIGGVMAGVAAVAVAKAPTAHAQTSPSVAVVLVNGETTAPETALLQAAGYTITQVTPATLAAMTQSTFDSYAAVVIGDSSTSSSCSATAPSASSLGSQWEGWVTGNVAVVGTAPARPGTTGADALITDAVGYAARQPSSGSVTGLYLSLNCGYSTSPAGTAVSLLAGVDGIGTAGVSVNGNLACTDTGTVNPWEASNAGTFGGFTGSDLGTGSTGFLSPSCPVEEAFDSWPAMFTPVAYDAGSDASANFTASDGVSGQPYVLLGTPPASAATDALAPSVGGEVPAGATDGGGSNPAARGVSQATAADPVNTENGDFTQSDTDLSIPTFGPSLSFARTYDADVAEQQAQAGTPGPLGYGWTDNWATSVASDKPAAGDAYMIDGLATDNGLGGPAAGAAIAGPSAVVSSGGNTYIADAAANQVIEIAGSTGTQWGISMTAGDAYVIVGSPDGASGLPASGTAASKFSLRDPSGIAVDNNGDVFIADTYHNVILELAASSDPWGAGYGDIPATATAGDVYYVAGTTTKGDGSDGEAATSSDLNQPEGVFIGGNAGGNLYIADTGNNRIQMVSQVSQTKWGQSMSPYDVYTVAGSSSGKSGDSGDSGAATSALLNAPADIAIDTDGDLIIADTGNNRIQEEAKNAGAEWGNSSSFTANDIYTVAGSSSGASGLGADNEKATSSDLDAPDAVASFGTVGDVFIADTGNNRVQELAASTGTTGGQSMTEGDIYTIAGSASGTAGDSGNGGTATSALLDGPEGLWNSGQTVYLADTYNNQVREASGSSPYDITGLAGDGYDLTDAGDGGPATGAALSNPDGVTGDADGNLYIADEGNNRVQEIAASSHTQFGIAMTAGDTYTIAGSATGALGGSPNGIPAASSLLDVPTSVAVDGNGDVYIADTDNNRIVEVAAAGHTQFGIAMTAGDTYTVAGSATGAAGVSPSGTASTSALLDEPSGIAVDKAGDLFIADTVNSRIEEVPAASGTQYGITMTAGDIYTIAGSATGGYGTSGDGGPGTSALLSDPFGVSVDAVGNVYIADTVNNRIQELAATTHTQFGQSMKAGDIYTIAGNSSGTAGNSGDTGPASSALLDDPTDVAADTAGDIYVADADNNQVREVAAANGTQWSQQMTAGDLYTIAGSTAGTAGNSGTGGPAASALLDMPIDVGTDPAGDVFIPDQDSSSILEAVATSSPAFPVYPVGGNITITQPGGAQITFYPQTSSGTCTSPLVTAGGYCVLPVNQGATLTSSTSNDTYTFVPSPGADAYTYSWDGNLISDTDTAGNTLTITYESPAPGSAVTGDSSQACPSTATACETITSASGRALVLGSNASGLVTSVTDPMGRQWTYAYNSSDQLTSATDPMGNVTSYTYGAGSNGPLQANNLLTITEPNAQPGGPDAGDDIVNVYSSSNEVTSQTDPMGWKTTFNYCVNAASGDCLDSATGTGFVTVTEPDGNNTVYDYDQGSLAAQSDWTGATGATLTSESDSVPDTAAPSSANPAGGSLQDTTTTDGDGETSTTTYDADGNPTSTTAPDGVGTQDGTATDTYTTALQDASCSSIDEASSTDDCADGASAPSPVAPGGVITLPSSAPPEGVTYNLYDTDGNELYSTTGVYSPSGSYEYSQTTYQLFKGNSVSLNGTDITCAYIPPSASLPCATINADDVVTQLEYDSQGDVISSSTPDGNGSQLATTTDTYNADGEQLTEVAPDGNVAGANAGNYATSTAYNADGEETTVTEGGGAGYTDAPRTTSYSYDADGNRTGVIDNRGYTTTTTYNADDKPILVTNPDGDATLTCYDAAGNVAQTVPAVGVAAGGLTAASCPTAYPAGYTDRLASDATTYTYDALNQRTEITEPAPAGQSGTVTMTNTYDGAGNLVSVTAPAVSNGGAAQVTTYTYNDADELASVTSGAGTSAASTVSYCYNADGDTTSVVYADGNTGGVAPCNTNPAHPDIVDPTAYPTQAGYQTTYSYDSADELVSTTTPATAAAPSGATTTATYDPDGNQLTSTDPDGVTTTWTYTPLANQATVTYSGSSAHSVTYSYDADGQLTSMTDGTGTSTYGYDSFGELTSAQNGAGQTVGYAYNADGDATGITYPLPASATWATTDTVTYGYDNADRLTSVMDFNGHQVAIGNTADGLPDSVGLGSSGDTIATTYATDDDPSEITLKNSASTLQSFSYADAPAGNVLTETDTPSSSNSPAVYTYDAKGEVTSMSPGIASALDYSFDPSGNLTTLPGGASGTYNDAGELTSQTLSGTTTSYTYNADGEQLSATQGSTTKSSATWTGAGQLATYSNAAADMTAASYNGNGLRASTTITPAGGSAATQGYVWNTLPSTPQLLMDGTNAYIYAGSRVPAEQVSLSAGTITYLIADLLGSVRGTVSSSGTLTGTTSYDAWGNPLIAGGLTATTPFGWAGGYTDPDGLIYLINRYYNPQLGQFTSVDPDLAQTLAPYAYGSGNPVLLTDPTGMSNKGWWDYCDDDPIGDSPTLELYFDYSADLTNKMEALRVDVDQGRIRATTGAFINALVDAMAIYVGGKTAGIIASAVTGLISILALNWKSFAGILYRLWHSWRRPKAGKDGFYAAVWEDEGTYPIQYKWNGTTPRSCPSERPGCGSPGEEYWES